MEMTRVNSALILLFAFVIGVFSTPLPGKVVTDEVNTIGKGDVGVSFGGYSASAGLGGGSAGGVLHAGAYAPGVGASAGLGGYSGGVASGDAGASSGAVGGAGAGAGVVGGAGGAHGGSGQHGAQGGFFDNIFNIPISVLKAVNTYLNQKGPGNGEHPVPPPPHHQHHHHHHEAGVAAGVVPEKPVSTGANSQAGAVAGSGTYASAGVVAEASASASASSGGAGHVKSGAGQGTVQIHPQKGNTNYDNIFNIPISTLDAVNQLLNG